MVTPSFSPNRTSTQQHLGSALYVYPVCGIFKGTGGFVSAVNYSTGAPAVLFFTTLHLQCCV